MKLKKFKVIGLFSVFDHEIELNKKGITIIIGENGLGKTILLEMIEAFFKSDYFYFNQVVFSKLILTFSDDVDWELSKSEDEKGHSEFFLVQFSKDKKKKKEKPYKIFNYHTQDVDLHALKISRRVPQLRRVGPKLWQDRRTLHKYTSEEVIQEFNSFASFDSGLVSEFETDDKPKWFVERHHLIDVSLIETQRLINIGAIEDSSHRKTVDKYSNELSKSIKENLSESTELSSKLDRTYPNRLIQSIKSSRVISDEELHEELKKLESKRELLDIVGLIEIEKDSNILEIQSPQKLVKEVLMLYVEDSSKKIEIFDTISRKIKILLDIINKRFKHKKLHIDKEEGFLFISTLVKDSNGEFQRIPVEKLSSGEQNELVLFYLLLFKTKENSLILIDEPEVSLHISWQNSFIEDLKEITALNNLEVIIATHSPDIIANNWDLKVDLKGLE